MKTLPSMNSRMRTASARWRTGLPAMLACAAGWVLLAAAPPASAQQKAPNFDKLDNALRDRMPSRGTSRSLGDAPPSQRSIDRNDYHWVTPKSGDGGKEGGGSRHDRSGAVPRTVLPVTHSGAEGEHARLPAIGWSGAAATHRPANPRFAQSAQDNAASGTDASQSKPAEPPAAVPVARKNSFVILIKPEVLKKLDGGVDDVLKLLQKYGLEPLHSRRHRSVVSPSGRIIVQQVEDTGVARSVAPPSGEVAKDVRSQLEPDIIRKLRKEGIVDDAYVNSTIRNNTLPRPVRTRAKAHGRMFGWYWASPNSMTTAAASTMPANGGSAETIDDGNWGLKSIRVPAMWTVIKRFREASKNAVRPKIAVIDQGFSDVPNLAYSIIDPQPVSASRDEPCEGSHGTHVAGIIAATAKNEVGIDGIVPDAAIDAVPFQLDYALEDQGEAEQEWMRRWVLFADVMNDTEDYVVRSLTGDHPLRVVNLSLAYNLGGLITKDPATVPELVRHIQAQAKDVQRTVRRYEDQVLFVVAAGNDSASREKPLDAKWASPLAWAGTQSWATSSASPNILVVEAFDREGKRADFSNVGGHLAAPGVDVLSTLGPGPSPFGVCSGTSQAAPHVAAIADLLFELDPKRKPKDIAEILRRTAMPSTDKSSAPRVDALEAVLRVYPDGVRVLADLNHDGKVDEDDLAIFLQHLDEIYDNQLNGLAFNTDLNGDGVTNNDECHWPASDLNGSGSASLDPSDGRIVLGARRTDLEVVGLAWSKGKEDFERAVAAIPSLGKLLPQATVTAAINTPDTTKAALAPNACR